MQPKFYDNLMRDLHDVGGGGDKNTFLYGALATQTSFHMVRVAAPCSDVIWCCDVHLP